MKKAVFSILLFFICICTYAQLQGSFSYGQDGHIYFYLTNPTGYQIPVVWGVYNFSKNEQLQFRGVMNPGGTFVYGPNENWVWEKGERFAVTYSNGYTEFWTCPETDPALRNSPSFGNNWTSVSVNVSGCRGLGGSLCSCKVYKGYKRAGLNQYKGKCTNYAGGHQCGHGPAAHGLTEY